MEFVTYFRAGAGHQLRGAKVPHLLLQGVGEISHQGVAWQTFVLTYYSLMQIANMYY